jgi:hypothetical protein
MYPKPQYAFAIYSEAILLPYSIRLRRKDCIGDFLHDYGPNEKWPTHTQRGYSIRKVKISVVPAKGETQ